MTMMVDDDDGVDDDDESRPMVMGGGMGDENLPQLLLALLGLARPRR